MPRSTCRVPAKKRHKKMIKLASGYRGANRYQVAKQKVEKALQYQYRDRRNVKRDMRGLAIIRVNAGLRDLGEKYSVFMGNLVKLGLSLNRKMLAKIAMEHPVAFRDIVAMTKEV